MFCSAKAHVLHKNARIYSKCCIFIQKGVECQKKIKGDISMKKIFKALLLATLVLALAACSSDTSDKLLIGVDDTYPPMEFRNDANELVGFDIDFANALATEMGVEIEFVPTAWDGIFSALKSSRYDMIISSVSITEDRLEEFEFSTPYLANGQVIVVNESAEMVNAVAELEGLVVGVQLGTTSDDAAKKQKELTPFELKAYDDIVQTFTDMKAGRLDAVVVDYAVAIEFLSNNPGEYKITPTQLTNEPIGVCIKQGNTELKDKVDKAIAALQENGTLVPISEEWLGGNYVTDIDEELR